MTTTPSVDGTQADERAERSTSDSTCDTDARPTRKVAVLGLGAMGSRIAGNLARAGHEVTVWNRTRTVAERLAGTHDVRPADSVVAAVADVDAVVCMVTDDEAAEAVWLDPEGGALDAMSPGSLAIESSTLTPATARHIASAAARRNVRFVEAPVVGSRPQAEAGALFYILAGDDDALDAAQVIVDVSAGNSIRVGQVGNAATLKLAVNGLFAAQVAAYAEIAGLLENSELDFPSALATLAGLPITSPGLQRILGLIERRDYEPNFPIHLVSKDLRYLTGADGNVDLPIMRATAEVFARGADGAERDLDIAGIARRYERSTTG